MQYNYYRNNNSRNEERLSNTPSIEDNDCSIIEESVQNNSPLIDVSNTHSLIQFDDNLQIATNEMEKLSIYEKQPANIAPLIDFDSNKKVSEKSLKINMHDNYDFFGTLDAYTPKPKASNPDLTVIREIQRDESDIQTPNTTNWFEIDLSDNDTDNYPQRTTRDLSIAENLRFYSDLKNITKGVEQIALRNNRKHVTFDLNSNSNDLVWFNSHLQETTPNENLQKTISISEDAYKNAMLCKTHPEVRTDMHTQNTSWMHAAEEKIKTAITFPNFSGMINNILPEQENASARNGLWSSLLRFLRAEFIISLLESVNSLFNCKETFENGRNWVLGIIMLELGIFTYFKYYYLVLGFLVAISAIIYYFKRTLKNRHIIGFLLTAVVTYILSTAMYILLIVYTFVLIDWFRTKRLNVGILDTFIILLTVLSTIFLFIFNDWTVSSTGFSISKLVLLQNMLFVFILFNMGMIRCILNWCIEAVSESNCQTKTEDNLKKEEYINAYSSVPSNNFTNYEAAAPLTEHENDTWINYLIQNSSLYTVYKFSKFWIYIALICSFLTAITISIRSGIDVKAALWCPLRVQNIILSNFVH